MKFDYNKLAHNSLRFFVREVRKAIEIETYELILAGGDSGNIMAWITQAVYRGMEISFPHILVLPTYRHADYAETILFDNRLLQSLVSLPGINIKQILLVDDEVGTGNTIRGLLAAIGEVSESRPKITFIAEDGGFDAATVEGWKINFRPPQSRPNGIYNAVSYIVPYNDQVPLKKVLKPVVKDMNDKHIMATLLDLPIKIWEEGLPSFTYKYRDLCQKEIPEFAKVQQEFQNYLKEQIRQALVPE